eukprot:1140791-Pelagomonas_calceolata.AAC.5
MAAPLYLTNHWVFSRHFFCNGILLVQGLQLTKNDRIWCNGWSGYISKPNLSVQGWGEPV